MKLFIETYAHRNYQNWELYTVLRIESAIGIREGKTFLGTSRPIHEN